MCRDSYMMVEGRQLDNIKATTQEATQYGYITLFSAAFPGARVAFVNNMFQMRTDGYKYLRAYRHPTLRVEDIGTYQSIFELMNYTGVMSSFLSIIYRTVIPKWPGAAAGEHSPTKHQLDCVFMVCCGFRLRGFGHLAADRRRAVTELQIKRNDFLNSRSSIMWPTRPTPWCWPTRRTGYCRPSKDTMAEYLTFDGQQRRRGRGRRRRRGHHVGRGRPSTPLVMWG